MKENVLFIDDDEEDFKIFLEAMSEVDVPIRYILAKSASYAQEILKAVTPDYIFVDLILPVIDGLQFISLARQDLRLKRCKIFLYSGKITDEVCEKAKNLGADDCIAKSGSLISLASDLKTAFKDAKFDFTKFTKQ